MGQICVEGRAELDGVLTKDFYGDRLVGHSMRRIPWRQRTTASNCRRPPSSLSMIMLPNTTYSPPPTIFSFFPRSMLPPCTIPTEVARALPLCSHTFPALVLELSRLDAGARAPVLYRRATNSASMAQRPRASRQPDTICVRG